MPPPGSDLSGYRPWRPSFLGALCRLNSRWITSEATSSADIWLAIRSEDFRLSSSNRVGACLPDRILSARFNRSNAPIASRICLTLPTRTSRYFPDDVTHWPAHLKTGGVHAPTGIRLLEGRSHWSGTQQRRNQSSNYGIADFGCPDTAGR